MGNFEQAHKGASSYLDIAANGNGSEKAFLTAEALRRLTTSEAHIIEIGPGGGAAINSLVDQIEEDRDITINLDLIEIESVQSNSLDTARERFQKRLGTTTLHTLDARNLSAEFPAGSTDIIASSAVLHEVYSYGSGYRGLHECMRSISSTLKNDGFFAYRDIFSVENPSLHETTIQSYGQQGWLRFIKLFIPHYLDNAVHPYHRNEDELQFRQDSHITSIENIDTGADTIVTGPVGLFREIQRHYLTFRDYVWRSGILGFTPVLDGSPASDWLDIKSGHKRIHYNLTGGQLLDKNQQQLLVAMSESQDDHYVIDGDIFDTVSDEAINTFLSELCNGDKQIEEIWKSWIEREGSETYAYMTLDQLLGTIALKSTEVSEGEESILLPILPKDVIRTPRAYYNRLLKSQLPNPLYDGKQLVLFQKTLLSDADKIQSGLEVIQTHCTKSTLAKLYSRITKKL